MNIESPQEMQEFKKLMNDVLGYYNQPINPSYIQVMLIGLQKYSISVLRSTFLLHTQQPDKGQFYPKVCDFIRIIDGGMEGLEMRAGKAWTTAIKAISDTGIYRSVKFDDPIITLVIQDMGGWVNFCTKLDDKNTYSIQKDFERRYKDFASNPMPKHTPSKLTGIAHQSNSQSYLQNDRIEGKTTKKMGYDAVMAKIRSFGLNVEPDTEQKKAGSQQ